MKEIDRTFALKEALFLVQMSVKNARMKNFLVKIRSYYILQIYTHNIFSYTFCDLCVSVYMYAIRREGANFCSTFKLTTYAKSTLVHMHIEPSVKLSKDPSLTQSSLCSTGFICPSYQLYSPIIFNMHSDFFLFELGPMKKCSGYATDHACSKAILKVM
jgi:hypothetical protein